MGGLSIWHLLLVAIVVLVLFGGKGKLADIMGDFAKGIKSFKKGLTDEEITRAKGAVTGSLVLSQEDSGSRMSRIGKSELVYGEVMSFDEILKRIAQVTPDDIREIASEVLPQSSTLAIVGPFKNESKFEKVIA